MDFFYIDVHDLLHGAERPYGEAFLATGCCNEKVKSEWWNTQSDATVLNDMYAYCELAKTGKAEKSQLDFCGCGENVPTTCTKQTTFDGSVVFPGALQLSG